MRFRVLMLAAAAVLVTAGPALAQSQGTSDNGGSSSHAGGSSVSGSSSSSSSVSTSGGSEVGVVQGNVSAGSTSSGSNNGAGDQSGSSTSGDSVSGQAQGVSGEGDTNANAAADGVVANLDLPAMDVGDDATTAAERNPSVLTWAMAAVIIAGLALLYRRLPRPARA